jgi:nitrate/TMAO reductase-like tetraheme cytochrome c subunit
MGAVVSGAAGAATALLIAIGMVMVVSGQAMANPGIAQKTGQPCTKCHSAPPVLNDYGKKYKEENK